ncbi:antitoxin Xre/MbcA/ParS toxin-binding domain-containing protein [Pseudomonas fulva]|uniref:antitoxin Xre/MbcA/ParS toxin-binding domain-containing protein n=1 Tax=Pseudomonas fulva TaxID=47880 RepID=UPI0009BB468E|nr:antitoxin Xre/MbcA/ParS toxin-binding domain-containing protein [Pseudomonas fulva]
MYNKQATPDVLAAALKLFNGSTEDANNWLNSPHRALGYKKPIDEPPCEVLKLISQIELGVYI